MLLIFDILFAGVIVYLSLALEKQLKGSSSRVLMIQMAIKIGGLALIGCRYWLEPRIVMLTGSQTVRAGLFIWLIAFGFGQIFIALSINERIGRRLNRNELGFLGFCRGLQAAMGMNGK